MKTRHGLRAVLTLVCVLALGLCTTVSALAEVNTRFANVEIPIITEKDEAGAHIIAVRNGTITTLDALDWEDGGIHGQAVHLNGAGDYIEYPNEALCGGEITVTGWLYWLGGVTDNADSELNQQLFTVYRDADNYYTLNLHGYRDNVRQAEDGTVYRMDGVSLEYHVSGSSGKLVEAYNLTSGGVDYAIRQKEWTHFAMTISEHAIKLYINGVHWFEEPLDDACGILDANGVRIGGTVGETQYTLSGLVDDVAVFKGIMDGDTIAYLASGAGLDFSAPTEKTEPTGTAADTSSAEPSSADTSGDNFKDTDNSGAFSDITIPAFTWYVLGGLFLLMVILTIALNKHEAKRQKEENR